MDMTGIVSIIAVIIAPIVSVCIGNYLQNRYMKRKDKMDLFKTLMTSRSGWTAESVRALNTLDIVFADDASVRGAWKEYYDKLCIENPTQTDLNKIQNAQYNLLEAMAVSLGYKNKITWKTIQNPYVPKGMLEAMQKQTLFQDGQIAATQMVLKILQGNNQQTSDHNSNPKE